VQRAYRNRLRSAGKAVKLVDADFDTAEHRAFIGEMRDNLHNALLRLEVQVQDLARLEQRNAYLEGELKLQHQHHTNCLKEIVLLKQQLAQMTQKPVKRR
jgi:hypothetical protein